MPKTSAERLEQALDRIGDPGGEGARACLTVYADEARAAARAADARHQFGHALGPLDGRIVSIKDLFDVAGEPTRAGSKARAKDAPAARDAPVVARLRAAGAVIVAKTNMSEFAFSGIGINPHYGTPGNPADRRRVPGGSSSGAAVTVGDGMCEIGIGTDTGGSCRIPASFCGIVGYKPTARLVPTAGAFPLSRTLDSIGPLARSVADCAATHAVLAGDEDRFPLADIAVAGLRLGVLAGPLLADLDEVAGRAFEATLKRLSAAGARIADCRTTLIADIQAANAKGGFSAPEAFALHRPYFDARKADFDQRVWQRIDAGRHMAIADYLDLAAARARLAAAFDANCAPYDALILPATPNVAPVIAEVDADDRSFFAHNARALRNTAFVNFVDGCAISIPMPTGGLPVGLQLVGRHGHDAGLFAVARAVEAALAG